MRRRAGLVAGLVCLAVALGLPSLVAGPVAAAAAADGTLSGRVVDPAGRPLVGADVVLQSPGTATVVGRATSDGAGQYRMAVPQGTYDAAATTSSAPFRRGLLDGVTVAADSRLTIMLADTAGASAPTVTFSGRLKDRNGNPVPGVGLSLSSASGDGGYASSVTAADGQYSFAVAPGRWSLSAYFYEGSGGSSALAVPRPSFDFRLSDFNLTANRRQDLTVPTFDLTVTVRDGSGAPVPGAAVNSTYSTSQSFELFPGGTATGDWSAKGTTDANGRTVLTGLPTASLALSATPAGTALGTTARTGVTLTANNSVDLVAKPPVTVRGVLRDHDGTAIAKAPVSLAGGYFTASTTTGADGSYSLSVGPGTWIFMAGAPTTAPYGSGNSFSFSTDPVSITSDRTQDLTAPGTALRVHVIDPTGAAVPSASVSAGVDLSTTQPAELFPGSGGRGWRSDSRVADGSGNADLVVIPGSTVSLSARPPSGSTYAGSLVQQVSAAAGTVSVGLRPTVTVRGVVDRSDPNGQISVNLYSSADPGGSTNASGKTAADGSYVLHAPTGTYDNVSVNQNPGTSDPPPPDRPTTWYLSGGSIQLTGDRTLDFDPPFVHVALHAYDESGSLRQLGATVYGMDGSGLIDVPMGSGLRSHTGYFSGTGQGMFTTEATFTVFPGAPWNISQYLSGTPTMVARGLSVSGDTDLALVATTPGPDPGPGSTTSTTAGSTTTSTGPSSSSTTTTSPTTTTTRPTTTTTTPAGSGTPPATTTPAQGEGAGTPGTPGVPTGHIGSGYWMTTADGEVHAFGDAKDYGSPKGSLGGARVVHLEPAPDGKGYWILDDRGRVHAYGSAAGLGDVDLATLVGGEKPSSLSASPTGAGYWVFTDRGRVLTFGDAAFHGDMSKTHLNGPIVGSVATPSGHGYWLVASDGGIFAYGDAAFHGSTGNLRLNKPVMGMAPAASGGYWLVASDGGIFAFDVPFHGSMGATHLNKPISGMVPGRDGYLMVGEDGGIFSFGDVAFHGSLGAHPP
ncbi:MAG: carboxypeptidase regulatory-like domain-containing protein, partial [Actinobacteria bacterium]|nr:carboxypeptidase regulatory-like domain-containing protein [Actinomycetota bacterium]